MKKCCIFVAALVLLACKGPDGVTGPPGPAGQSGPAGSGTRLEFVGNAVAGINPSANLPAAAGDMSHPPLYACYLQFNGPWLQTGQGAAQNTTCAMSANADATLHIVITFAQAGQAYAIVVVY